LTDNTILTLNIKLIYF